MAQAVGRWLWLPARCLVGGGVALTPDMRLLPSTSSETHPVSPPLWRAGQQGLVARRGRLAHHCATAAAVDQVHTAGAMDVP